MRRQRRPTRYQLPVTPEQQAALVHLRDHAAKPSLRERAAVLVAIGQGASIRQAAQHGGRKPHDADTVCVWVARYQTRGRGPQGLVVGGQPPGGLLAARGLPGDGISDAAPLRGGL